MDTPEIQKENLKQLYQKWFACSVENDDETFTDFNDYVLAQELTFPQVAKIISSIFIQPHEIPN